MLYPGVQLSKVTRDATVVPALFGFFSSLFGVVPGAPTTIGIHFSKPFEFHARFWYLSTSSCSFSVVFWDTAMSIKSAVLLSCTTTIAGHLCSITQSLWTLTYQRILTLSLSLSLVQLYVSIIVPNVASCTSYRDSTRQFCQLYLFI